MFHSCSLFPSESYIASLGINGGCPLPFSALELLTDSLLLGKIRCLRLKAVLPLRISDYDFRTFALAMEFRLS